MDEIRTAIWDLLYRESRSMSVEEIVEKVGSEEAIVREAVNHEWFQSADGNISIAKKVAT